MRSVGWDANVETRMESVPFDGTTRLAVMTGAGISAESGVTTFRERGGLWEQYNLYEVARPEAFAADPRRVWEFYNLRRAQLPTVEPNAAHRALAKLEAAMPDGQFTLITQNVDDLHDRAGSKRVIHMHGELAKVRCTGCGTITETLDDLGPLPHCDSCGAMLRPHIVWFGEVPMFLDEIDEAVRACTLFLVVGTSGVVYPAAGMLSLAKACGARSVGVNLDEPDNVDLIDHFFQGKAGEILPPLVEDWLSRL
jgi:NAD-dependent deacetylase